MSCDDLFWPSHTNVVACVCECLHQDYSPMSVALSLWSEAFRRTTFVCTVYIIPSFEITSSLMPIALKPPVQLSYAFVSTVLSALSYFTIYIKLREVLDKPGPIWRRFDLKMRLEDAELMTLKLFWCYYPEIRSQGIGPRTGLNQQTFSICLASSKLNEISDNKKLPLSRSQF